MTDKNPIIDGIDDIHGLEMLFRQHPEGFREHLAEAIATMPDSKVLMVWKERLEYSSSGIPSRRPLFGKELVVMLLLAVAAGITARIALLLFEQKPVLPVNMVTLVIASIAALFVAMKPPKGMIRLAIAAMLIIPPIFVNLLPSGMADSTTLAYLHLPILLWIALGLAFAGDSFQKGEARLSFLKFNGQFAVIYLSMAVAGMMLAALTSALFGIIGLDISEFYFTNVVLFGAASLAVVAAYLASGELKLAKAVAPYLARIFSPLILATLVVYLAASAWMGKNPLSDRDFLLSFNFLLIAALAVTIFSIAERGAGSKKDIGDFVNAALIAFSIAVDAVALFSILFRLASYGITPNRLAVLGMNLAVLVNLFLVLVSYVGFIGDRSDISPVQRAVTGYLPIYGAWAAIVVFVFPLMFS